LKKGPEFELKAAIDEDSTVTELLESLLKGKISMELRQVLAISKPEYRKAIVEMLRRRKVAKGDKQEAAMVGFLAALEVQWGWEDGNDGEEEDWSSAIAHEPHVGSLAAVQSSPESLATASDKSRKPSEVAHVAYSKKMEVEVPESSSNPSHYRHAHWARANPSAVVELRTAAGPSLSEVALIDEGSELNLMDYSLFMKLSDDYELIQDHGWRAKGVGGYSDLPGAIQLVAVTIGNVTVRTHFFLQQDCGHKIILGQPWKAEARYASQSMNDGSQWARIQSQDDRLAVQFMVVPTNHYRNRRYLTEAEYVAHTLGTPKPIAATIPSKDFR